MEFICEELAEQYRYYFGYLWLLGELLFELDYKCCWVIVYIYFDFLDIIFFQWWRLCYAACSSSSHAFQKIWKYENKHNLIEFNVSKIYKDVFKDDLLRVKTIWYTMYPFDEPVLLWDPFFIVSRVHSKSICLQQDPMRLSSEGIACY